MWRSVYVYPVGVCINGASVKWLRYLSCGAGESGASQGGSAVVKVSIIIFTPVGSHEVVQETVSAQAAGWGGSGGGFRHTQRLFHTEDYDQQSRSHTCIDGRRGALVAPLQWGEKSTAHLWEKMDIIWTLFAPLLYLTSPTWKYNYPKVFFEVATFRYKVTQWGIHSQLGDIDRLLENF